MGAGSVGSNIVVFITTWGLRVVGVVGALAVAWLAAGWLQRTVQYSLERRNFDKTLGAFFARVARWALLAAVVIGCLGVFGIETTSFAAVLGAAGLAIGLAFQGTLSNFAAGVMLLVFRPFKVGDVVKIGGEVGAVDSIDLFTTDLTTPDNRRIIMPNSQIFGHTIENLTHNDKRRVDVPVGVEYSADIEETRRVLEAVVPGIEGVLADPPPQVFLKGLGDSSVDWVMRVWTETPKYWDVHQATIQATKKALDAAELGIPFPQMDVHLDEALVKALAKK